MNERSIPYKFSKKDRAETHESSRNWAENATLGEGSRLEWTFDDSMLYPTKDLEEVSWVVGTDRHYQFNGSIGVGNYSEYFTNVVPDNDLKAYLEESFSGINCIGIDLGGPGSRLFKQFSDNLFERTLGVTLSGNSRGLYETAWEKEDGRKADHTIIATDLFRIDAYEDIDKWLEGRKVDIIFQRMVGGLGYSPQDPYFFAELLNIWYQKMSDIGVMFMQVPEMMEPLMESWKELIEKNYSSVLEVDFAEADTTSINQYYSQKRNWRQERPTYVMRLNKYPGAPLNLPLLTPKEMRANLKVAHQKQEEIKRKEYERQMKAIFSSRGYGYRGDPYS